VDRLGRSFNASIEKGAAPSNPSAKQNGQPRTVRAQSYDSSHHEKEGGKTHTQDRIDRVNRLPNAAENRKQVVSSSASLLAGYSEMFSLIYNDLHTDTLWPSTKRSNGARKSTATTTWAATQGRDLDSWTSIKIPRPIAPFDRSIRLLDKLS
jgi:hypothetical protein